MTAHEFKVEPGEINDHGHSMSRDGYVRTPQVRFENSASADHTPDISSTCEPEGGMKYFVCRSDSGYSLGLQPE